MLRFVLFLSLIAFAFASDCPHFTYEEEGSTPDKWGDLCPDYALCKTGTGQSPINIVTKDADAFDFSIAFAYGAAQNATLTRNEHTIQVLSNTGPIKVDDEDGKDSFNLVQFHFHHPSEHTLNGKSYDLEVHYVHKDASGNLAVVGYFVQASTTSCKFLEELEANLPDVIDETTMIPVLHILTPFGDEFFHYTGSLTVPPCTENVAWFVQKQPLLCTQAQVDMVSSILGVTNRPVQSFNGRDLFFNANLSPGTSGSSGSPASSGSSGSPVSSSSSSSSSSGVSSGSSGSSGSPGSSGSSGSSRSLSFNSSSSSATQVVAGLVSLVALFFLF